MKVATDVAGVARHWGNASESRKVVGAGETAEIAAGGGQQLGAQQWTYAGHAGDHCGEFVLPEPVCNESVQRVDLLAETGHLQRQLVNYLGNHALAWQLCVAAELPQLRRQPGFQLADIPVGQPQPSRLRPTLRSANGIW